MIHLRPTRKLVAKENESADEEEIASDFALPVIARQYCDVDQHVVPLAHYRRSLELIATTSHASVPFAAAAHFSEEEDPLEVIWEGRIFDNTVCAEPHEYPNSKYKSLRFVWYRQLKI
jgi:hypothetical protein